MGNVRDSIDEVMGGSNPVGFWLRLRQMPFARRVFAIVDRF